MMPAGPPRDRSSKAIPRIRKEEADAPEWEHRPEKEENARRMPTADRCRSQTLKVSFDTLSMAFDTESYTPGTMENPSPLVRHGI